MIFLKLKIGTQPTPVPSSARNDVSYFTPLKVVLRFCVRCRYVTDRRTDGRTDGTDAQCGAKDDRLTLSARCTIVY